MNRSRVQLLERACSEDAIQDKGNRRGPQVRKRGKRQRMDKLLEKARKDNEHQHADENRPKLDVQSPSRNDERHDRRAKRDHSRDDHREGSQAGMARSRRPPRPSHMHADSPTLPGVYQWATKRHMWGTRCSGGKSAGLEHLRAPYHRPSMWEGLYPLSTIRDGNTFDKITTLLTGAEMTQGRLA